MTKRGIIHCILSILLMAYLAVGIMYARMANSETPYRAFEIRIDSISANRGFVTAQEINAALGHIADSIARRPGRQVNTQSIEDQILMLDNIESANCVKLNNRSIRLDVTPMIPVARVFDTSLGKNFYINRQGKTMQASPQFRIDVPIVVGDFSWRASYTDPVPVLDYLAQHPDMGAMVSAIKITKNGDIYLVPMIRGHIILFGDNTMVDNKFERLRIFYENVMPVKGWEYYDQISVKWKGQVVATRHTKDLPAVHIPQEDESDVDDAETMGSPADTIPKH